jgi:HD-GYP domain-containing protein (c-di-GMP phosphodiesterase class II)
MQPEMQINMGDVLMSLSKAQSIIAPAVGRHQFQVAYMAYRLAEELKMPDELTLHIFLGALIHDIGALSIDEKREVIQRELRDVHLHAFRGAYLLEDFPPLYEAANLIRFHHVRWEHGKGSAFRGWEVAEGSHLMHLADRISVLIRSKGHILSQVGEIVADITDAGEEHFMPEHIEAFKRLSRQEYIWLDMVEDNPIVHLPESLLKTVSIQLDEVVGLSYIFSHIIDFVSEFTSRHSAGVAKTAERLAELFNFSPRECKEMLVAGYLHDIGKLAIDSKILEKPDVLNDEEFDEIRGHTYYTFRILEDIGTGEFANIRSWAAYHHERLDGRGYPFHLDGQHLTLGARLMAVADIFTAITEDRPYRKGMDEKQAVQVLRGMKGSALDSRVVDMLIEHFDELNARRSHYQQEAAERYRDFFAVKLCEK